MGRRRKITSIVVSLLVLGISTMCRAGAAEQLTEADTYEKTGRFAQTEPIYQQIAAANPGTDVGLEAQRKLAIMYIDWDKGEKLETAFVDLLTNFSQNETVPNAAYTIPQRYEEAYEKQKADIYYRRIITKWPVYNVSVLSRMQLAMHRIDDGNDGAVDAIFADLVNVLPNDNCSAYATYHIAAYYYELGKYQRAVQYFQYVLDRWPNYDNAVHCQTFIATANLYLGNTGGTKAAIDKMCRDFADGQGIGSGIWNIVKYYRELEKYQDGRQFFQSVLDSNSHGNKRFWALTGVAMCEVGCGNDSSVQSVSIICVQSLPQTIRCLSHFP